MQDTIGQNRHGSHTLERSFMTLLTVLFLSFAGVYLAPAAQADEAPAGQTADQSAPAAASKHVRHAKHVREAEPLVWQHDYNKALSLAAAKDKLVLIDLYTDWCTWCKVLDRDTYSNADVQTFLNKQFVLLKLNAEDGADGEAMAKKFQVPGFPCTLIVDAQGHARGRVVGYRSAQEFPESITKALHKDSSD